MACELATLASKCNKFKPKRIYKAVKEGFKVSVKDAAEKSEKSEKSEMSGHKVLFLLHI